MIIPISLKIESAEEDFVYLDETIGGLLDVMEACGMETPSPDEPLHFTLKTVPYGTITFKTTRSAK